MEPVRTNIAYRIAGVLFILAILPFDIIYSVFRVIHSSVCLILSFSEGNSALVAVDKEYNRMTERLEKKKEKLEELRKFF